MIWKVLIDLKGNFGRELKPRRGEILVAPDEIRGM
jgi:hypothetical protein